MSTTTTIPFIEMSEYHDQAIHCPFCGKDLEQDQREGGDFAPCEHTLLMAHSEFWLYLSERAETSLSYHGFTVERDESGVFFTKADDEDFDIDDILSGIQVEEAVGFHRIVGPPVLESDWIAFAPVSK